MEQVVTSYLKHLKIPISERYCNKRIASHPDYPSILAVADTLQQIGIGHTVARVDIENLSDLPFPALLHLETAGGSLLPVYDSKELEKVKEKLAHWSGVLIIADPTTELPDNENAQAIKEDTRYKSLAVIFILAMVGLLSIPLLLSFSWLQLLFLTTTLAGVSTGYILFSKDLGITYLAVERFCNSGTGSGCGKVLGSNEGKLFGFITFSDLTLCFFVAQLFAVGLLVPLWMGSSLLSVLAWMSMFAVPVIGYSLWLQAVVIKEWCRLCLVVSGVLIVQALSFGYLFYSGLLNPMATGLPETVIVFLLFGLTGSSFLLF